MSAKFLNVNEDRLMRSTFNESEKITEIQLNDYSDSYPTFNGSYVTHDDEYREKLKSVFLNTVFYFDYSQSMSIGKVIGLTAGAILGVAVGGPAWIATGVLLGGVGYGIGCALGCAIKGGYDGAVKGGFPGAVSGFFGMPLINFLSYKGVVADPDEVLKNKREEIFDGMLARFVTPIDYQDTVDNGLLAGASFGACLGVLGGQIAMHKCSEFFGLMGSVINGVVKGGYDGAIKGGFAGLLDGVIYGAAVGYFNYYQKFNVDTVYGTPLEAILTCNTESMLEPLTSDDPYAFITDLTKDNYLSQMHAGIRKAYMSFNFFAESSQKSVAQQKMLDDEKLQYQNKYGAV